VRDIILPVFDADFNELGVRHFSRFLRSGHGTIRSLWFHLYASQKFKSPAGQVGLGKIASRYATFQT
jgi:hypothetical protein